MLGQVTFFDRALGLSGYVALWILGLRFLYCLINHIYKILVANPIDLTKYNDKWAVVTGSTDGIGRAFALALAEKGVNLILISRSQEKLDMVAVDIRHSIVRD